MPPSAPSLPTIDDSWQLGRFVRAFLQELARFAVGLIAIGLLGLVLGAIFRDGLIAPRPDQYFAGLERDLKLILFLPLPMVVFIIIAFLTKQWRYIFYPLAAFSLATTVNTHLQGLNVSADVIAALTVMTSYLLTHTLLWNSLGIVRDAQMQSALAKWQRIAIHMLILIATLCAINAAWSLGAGAYREAYIRPLRLAAAVQLPSTNAFFAVPGTPDGGFAIYYAEPTAQLDGTYQYFNGGQSHLLDGPRDVRTACGDKATYRTTQTGVIYGETTTNQPGGLVAPFNVPYHDFAYCFVVGSRVYNIVRGDNNGRAYLDKYPIEDVIAAFPKAPVYYPACATAKPPVYCKPGDKEAVDKLAVEKTKRFKDWISPDFFNANKPSASGQYYSRDYDLVIKEWSIKVPVSVQFRQAYYKATSDPNLMLIGNPSRDSGPCAAGIAQLTRQRVTSTNQAVGTVVGEYVYRLQPTEKCLQDKFNSEGLPDVMSWAEANIH